MQIQPTRPPRAWLTLGLLVCVASAPPAWGILEYSPPQPVHVTDLTKVPREVIGGARAALVSRVGEEFAAAHLPLDSAGCVYVPAYKADSTVVAHMDAHTRATRAPEEAHWTLTYRLRMHDRPYVRGTVTVDVDSTGRPVGERGIVGIGECARHPEECGFSVDSTAAVTIARRGGLEPGTEPWRVHFFWAAYPTPRYAWVIQNTTRSVQYHAEGQIWFIDANSGEIVARHMWIAEP